MDAQHTSRSTERCKHNATKWTPSEPCLPCSTFTFSFCFHFQRHQTSKQLPQLCRLSTHQHICVRFVVSILFKFVEQMFERNKEWPKQIQSTQYSVLARPLAVTAIYFAYGGDIPFAFHLCVRLPVYMRLVSHQIRLYSKLPHMEI